MNSAFISPLLKIFFASAVVMSLSCNKDGPVQSEQKQTLTLCDRISVTNNGCYITTDCGNAPTEMTNIAYSAVGGIKSFSFSASCPSSSEKYSGYVSNIQYNNSGIVYYDAYINGQHCEHGTDTLPPFVFSTNPIANAKDVSAYSVISVVFSEEMDSSTFTTSTFILKDYSGNLVKGKIIYSSGTTTAFFKSNLNLIPDSTYTATITKGVRDSHSNPMAAEYIWNFTVSGDSIFRFSENFLAWTGSIDPNHPRTLVRINGLDGTITYIGGSENFFSIKYAPNGTLYGFGSELHMINPSDGSTVKIGSFQYNNKVITVECAAFSPNGTLYGCDYSMKVYTVDLSNANLTYIGKLAKRIYDLEFLPNGNLYATSLLSLLLLNPSDMSTISSIDFNSDGSVHSLMSNRNGTLFGLGRFHGGSYFINDYIFFVNTNNGQVLPIIPPNCTDISSVVVERP